MRWPQAGKKGNMKFSRRWAKASLLIIRSCFSPTLMKRGKEKETATSMKTSVHANIGKCINEIRYFRPCNTSPFVLFLRRACGTFAQAPSRDDIEFRSQFKIFPFFLAKIKVMTCIMPYHVCIIVIYIDPRNSE